MSVRQFVTAVGLYAKGEARQLRTIIEPVEYDVPALWIGRKACLRIAHERRDLEVQPVTTGILISNDPIMRRLTLILVEVGRIERAPTVQDKLRFLSRYVGDLELADCGATESGQAAGVRYDARYIAECAILTGAVVDGVTRADRISTPISF